MTYKLGDLTVKNWNSWDRVPRAEVIMSTVFSSLTAGTLAYYAAYAVSYIAVTAVTSWALRALSPSPSFSGAGSRGLLTNTRNATAPQQIVYGEMRKGGVVTFIESTGDTNQYLHQIIVLAGHEVNSIGDIYINENKYEVNGSGYVTDQRYDEETEAYVTDNKWGYDSGTSTSKIRIKKHTGADNQSADSDLESETSVTSDFKGEGIAYIYVRMEYDQDVFAEGVPLFTAKVQGKKLYDPRTSTTVYSANAALCIRDYLVSAYGLDNSGDTNDAYFQTAANTCDEDVTLSGSGTENRYEINGVISLDQTPSDVLGDMMTACAGTLFWGQGEWHLKVGEYTSSIKTFTLDDLRGPITLDTKHSRRDNFNIVRGTFNDANQGFIRSDYPEIRSSSFITDDNGVESALDLALPLTTSASMAQRLAKMTLFRGREQMTLSGDFGLEAFEVECGDIIALNMDRYGFSAKEFEVVGWKFRNDGDAGDLRVGLTLRETSSAAFSWSAEESDITGNDSTLTDPTASLDIASLTTSGGGRTTTDGTFINSVIVSWAAPTNKFITHYDVEWKAVADSNYAATTTTETSIELSPLVDGVQYIIRVRAVAANGRRGDFVTATFTGGGDTTAPALPTAISATGGFKYITVEWTNPADSDLNFVEIYENTTNTSTGASKVGISGGDSFTRTNLGLNLTRYYFLKSVDYSGNASAFTTGVSATTNFIDDDDFANGVYSLFTDQGLYAIEDVTSLPASGDFEGQKVFNRTDGKLYQWTGSAWEQVVGGAEDFSDLTGSIAGAQIPDGLIDTLKLANDAVTNAKIATNAVTGDVIASGAITETKISSGAITTPKIAAGAVTASEIAAGSITSSQIAADTIAAGNIATGAITADEIASNAITSAKITAGAIIGDKIAANAITGAKIAAGEITGDKITANTITGGLIAASGIITNSAQITDAVVTNAKIANAAITSAKIQDLAVTSAKIGSLNADKITAGVLNAARIPTLSTNKFSTMSGQYGNRSGATDSPAASGTITSFTYTPSSASVALLTLFIQGVLETRPGGEGSYSFTIEVFVNSSLVLSTGGVGNTDGTVSVTLQGNYAFNASANTSQTVTVGWRQYNGRKGKLQINNGVISSIFTQD